MKKFLSVFIILLICTALVACGGAEQGGTPGSSGTSDTQQTGTTTQPVSKIPPAQPEKPEGLTERVRYECSEEGFYAVYEYCDARGNAVQEHYYAIDTELGILDCRILAYNTYDGGGNIVTSEGHYMQNPYYGTYDTVLTIQALHGMEYDYSVSDAQGNVQLYIKQSTDAQGRAVKEEYYGIRGRYIRSEEWTYHAGGAVKEHKSTDARGRTKLLCEYDENGNFTKCTVYDAAGRARTVHTAEYSGSTLVKHTVSGYSESGGLTGTTETRFDEKGRITERPGCRYVYTEDGRLTQVIKNVVNTYSFNEKGYVIEYSGSVMGSATTHITTSYSYDSLGRLSAVSTRNQYGIHRSSVAYTYDADGACKVVHTNEYGIENYMVYTDEYGRVIKEETYNNVRRTKHYTYSYDSYGRLTESVYYDKDKKKEVITYTYNDHGDLIREDALSYQSSGFTYNTYVTYDYYADGSLRSMDRYGSDGFRESGREYYEDGGYTVYTYGFDDEMIRAETYDIGGNNIRSEYNENGENKVVTREFYGFEKEKTVFCYINGLLVRGYEYAEDGSLFKEHERNEKGVVVTTQILRDESGNVIRKDVWHDNVYAGYTEYFYFENSPVRPVPVQKETSYDAQGNKIFYLERKFFYYPDGSTHSDCCVIKEEHYENGVITAYKYSDYGFFYDHRFYVHTEEILADGELTLRNYSYELRPVENADDERVTVCREEKFIGGKRVSLIVFEIDITGGKTYFIFDENENVIKKYYEHENGDKGGYSLYTYHGNGKLKSEHEYKSNGDILFSAEYDEAGNMTRKDTYKYSSTLELFKHISYFYDKDGKVIYQTESGRTGEKQIYHTYDDAGRLIKSNTFEKGELIQSDVYEYDERGNIVHEYNDHFASDGTVRRLNEFRYEYNEKDQLIKSVHVGWMNGEDSIDIYAYHENGKISFHGRYLGDRVIEELYYDEDGRITQPPSKS